MTDGMPERRHVWERLAYLLVPAVVFIAYLPALDAGFVYDDALLIEQNALLRRSPDLGAVFGSALWDHTPNPSQSYYRPLVILSYVANAAQGGLDPLGFHIVNLLLHTGNVLLVLVLVRRLSRSLPLAAASAVIFGLHPANSEAVAWVSGRSDVLAAFFSLLALVLYVRAFPPQTEARSGGRAVWAGSAVCLFAALLSKESAATVLGVLVLYEIVLRRHPRGWVRILPHAAALGVYLVLRATVIGFGQESAPFLQNPLVAEPWTARVLTGCSLFGRYVGLLVVPTRLSVDYSFDAIPVVRSALDGGAAIGFLALGSVVAGAVVNARRIPLASFGLGFFVVTGTLAFGNALFPFGNLFAERYVYLPSAGLILAGTALARHLGAAGERRSRSIALGVLLVAVAAGCYARTARRTRDWRDNRTLFASAVQAQPGSALAHNNLADACFKLREWHVAEQHYRRALEIHPRYADPHVGLGNLALERGDAQAALVPLQRAVELEPSSAAPYLSLGRAYLGLGKLAEAERVLQTGRRLRPEDTRYLNNLALVHAARKEPAKAAALWRQAVGANPRDFLALHNLALYHEVNGDTDEARALFRRFLAVAPAGYEDLKAHAHSALTR